MAHQPALRPDPHPRLQPVETLTGKKQPGRVNDDADHLSELTATLAANGGGESSSDLALDLVLNEIVEQARVTTSASGAAIALNPAFVPSPGENPCPAKPPEPGK